MKTIIVSYFSDVGDSTYYSDHGKRLSEELEALGDRYSIVGLEGHGDLLGGNFLVDIVM